ncbi:hypothetical protein FS837_012630 [Tulasnella sp. UAMH 9824]|nr:hypothetical protein FS837_012630 [Tulasnella sp. UAMH 9824]
MNSFTPVNSANANRAPEPRWSGSPEPTSRPSKVGNVSSVASKSGGVKQKDPRTVQKTNDATQSNPLPATSQTVGQPLARPAKTPGAASSKTKFSYVDAFSSSEEEEEEDGDVEMKNTNPKPASKTKSKAHTFLSPSPPPDLTPSRPKSTSSIASAPSLIRPRQQTESEEEAPEINTRQTRTDGPPPIASSAKKPTPGVKLGAQRLLSPLPRQPAKGNVRSEGNPRQGGSSSDESSSEEEEEEIPAQQLKKSGQDAAVKKGNLNAKPTPQPTPKSALPPDSSIARPTKLSRQDITPKPQERRAASPVKSLQKDKRVESSDSETSSSSNSEDEKAVSDAIKKSTKGSNSSDSSSTSKDAPVVDVRRKPIAAQPSALQSVSHTPAQRSFPSLHSLSSQPRRPAQRPNFLSQPRRPESSQARQQSDQNDSDESVDDSSDDDDVPKERRAGVGAQSLKKKAGRLQAWV